MGIFLAVFSFFNGLVFVTMLPEHSWQPWWYGIAAAAPWWGMTATMLYLMFRDATQHPN